MHVLYHDVIISDLWLTYYIIYCRRHNALGLKDIALEFILMNLNDASVVTGLSVSSLCFNLLFTIHHFPHL